MGSKDRSCSWDYVSAALKLLLLAPGEEVLGTPGGKAQPEIPKFTSLSHPPHQGEDKTLPANRTMTPAGLSISD